MKETVVGILFFISIGLLLYFTVIVKEVTLVGGVTPYSFDVLFQDIQYLKKGHPVVFAGQQIGIVDGIRFDEQANRVRVTLLIKGAHIPRNAKIAVVSSTLFGGKAVSISRPEVRGKEFYEEGKTYNGTQEQELMESLKNLSNKLTNTVDRIQDNLTKTIENAEKATKNLAEVTEKINTGQGTLGKLVNDQEMGESLKKTVANLQNVTKKLSEEKGTLGRLVGDPKMGEDVGRITSNVADITEKINTGQGTLGKLVNDSAVYQNLSRISANVDQIVEKMARGEGSLGKLLTDSRLYDNVTDVAANVRTITKDIVDQKGMLGRVVSDEKMGENFAQTMQNLKEASESIKNIANKIDSGQGTLGDLVNSSDLVDSAKSAIANLDKTLGKVARSETVVGLGYFYYDEQKLGAAKGYIRVIPSRTRYFQLGATIFFPDNDGPIGFDKTKKDEGKLILFPDVLMGKVFYFNDDNNEKWDDINLSVQLGILEGQVGGGVSIDFLDSFRISLEARTAHKDAGKFHENINRYMARTSVSVRLFKYFRAYVGLDNFVENGALSFGLTTEWYDDDVKTLVSLVSAAK